MAKELKVGEVIEFQGYKIQVVEDPDIFRCTRCCFDAHFGQFRCFDNRDITACVPKERQDGKLVRFEIIK